MCNMDLVEFIEDDFDEFINHITRPHRRRIIRRRPDHYTELDETDFRIRFRLTKQAVSYLLSLIIDDIKTQTD